MTSADNDTQFARQAFTHLERHRVAPNPENFAIWFHYAHGKNQELVQEINSIVQSGTKFTPDSCAYLYNKYMVANRNQKALDDAAIASQKILLDVLKVVNDFSGEQKNYNQDIDTYITDISKDLGNDSVKDIVKNIVHATTKLKASGEQIEKRLEESKAEISSLRKNLQQVTIEAQRDFLTGVFNRKTFEKMFDELAMVAKENKGELCLAMVDIDHFKRFNDKFGHLLGDEVLKTVARSLTECLKGRDVVARFGGEEFVVVLPNTPIDGALVAAENIRRTIAGKELKRKDTGENFGSITVSIGMARFRHDGDTLPTLLKRADDALYQSKHLGRNRVTRGGD